jgi:redoxin
VRREVRELHVTYPVVLDNDLKMWDALGNQFWPTVYLVDRKGRIRYVHVGETHGGSEEAVEVERVLAGLLKESS